MCRSPYLPWCNIREEELVDSLGGVAECEDMAGIHHARTMWRSGQVEEQFVDGVIFQVTFQAATELSGVWNECGVNYIPLLLTLYSIVVSNPYLSSYTVCTYFVQENGRFQMYTAYGENPYWKLGKCEIPDFLPVKKNTLYQVFFKNHNQPLILHGSSLWVLIECMDIQFQL
jgi:hypothetical protein